MSQLAALAPRRSAKGGRWSRARSRDAPRPARRRVHQGRRPQSAAAPDRPARRRRSDGVLFPQQRSERRLLQRADQQGSVPPDRDHDAASRSRRRETTINAETAEHAEQRLFCGFSELCVVRRVGADMPVHETDICIIGGGITSAMLAERLSELRPGVRIAVVEAGRSIFDAQNRGRYRAARDRLRRASVARRLHRGSAGQRHHLDDDGGRRPGAALGRRVQPLLRGGSAAEVDVRPGHRLADRVARARDATTARRSGG